MANRINKPRVFLSHSVLDKGFIENLASDLRRCRIEPWLDTEEIRDGKPWMKVIFEDGIPTCDAVIVYLTQNSLQSKMVAKEMDAALIEQLSERGISFLPYVSKAELRSKLRLDIRSLQCREWNEENYQSLLPSVVAEIWHSYLEQNIKTALLQEQNQRLSLELELKKLQQRYKEEPFSPSEEREFQYLQQKLNRMVEVSFKQTKMNEDIKTSTKVTKDIYRFSLLSAIIYQLNQGYVYFDYDMLIFDLDRMDRNPKQSGNLEELPDPTIEIQTYGLVRHIAAEGFRGRTDHKYEFTEKMYRFKYWLDYNEFSVENLSLEFDRSLVLEQ
jgi:hypothetical protein